MDILSIALTTLIVLVVAHFCVYYVVRTLYPPTLVPSPAPAPAQILKTNIEPSKVNPLEQQHVDIPTYETPVSMDTKREEGATNLENLLQDPPVQRDARVDPPQS